MKEVIVNWIGYNNGTTTYEILERPAMGSAFYGWWLKRTEDLT